MERQQQRGWSKKSYVGQVSAGLVALLCTVSGPCLAQGQKSYRLTVRPQTMATGTQNPAAGEYPLDAAGIVSVSPQCAGAHRCPLLIFLPGAGQAAQHITNWLRPVTDKYGMLLFAPSEAVTYDPSLMDAALKEILRRFAIAPDQLAIIGRCASGGAGMQLGVQNLDVFTRMGAISGGAAIDGLEPKNTTAEFYIDTGMEEVGGSGVLPRVGALRQGGHPVKHIVGLRGHEDQVEDYEFLGRWLHESWTLPMAARTKPVVVADPLPVLTVAAVQQMAVFWTAFAQEPDSIRVTARRAHLHEVVVPVGEERPSVVMMDLPALAAQYPSVAADLKRAGLTAVQHDAYRVALINAYATQSVGKALAAPAPGSPVAQNLALLDAHPDELQALAQAGVQQLNAFADLGGTLPPDTTMIPGVPIPISVVRSPAATADLGPMGIWRTP